MTDPSPQAVTCLHCGKTVSEGIERDCYGSKTGMHNWVEPAEPSPAPPAEPFDGIVYFHEWVALGKPDRSYANWLEFQLATAQAALREHHEMAISEDQAYQGSDMYIKTLAALKPVSDRQPEGETKCQIG